MFVRGGRTDSGNITLHIKAARRLAACARASAINTLHLIDSFNYSTLIYVNPFGAASRDIVGYNYVGGFFY